MTNNPEKRIIGKIAETIVEEMLKEIGFLVMKLGQENTINPLNQLPYFINKCTNTENFKNFWLNKDEKNIDEATFVDKLPDFVIVGSNGKLCLFEVKFKRKGQLYEDVENPKKNDDLLFDIYPKAHLFTVNLEVDKRIIDEGETYDEDYAKLKATRFHVWEYDGKNRSGEMLLMPRTFEEFLKEEFNIDNAQGIIKKYEDYVTKWLSVESG